MGPVELALKIFPLNANLDAELKKLEAEGWQAIQGMEPTVTYVMFRQAPIVQEPPRETPIGEGLGKMTIDETKVHVYRNGKLVEAGESSNG